MDGIERDITDVTPEEVETVTILKDAAAVAIYGHKGINGVVNITTNVVFIIHVKSSLLMIMVSVGRHANPSL